MGQHLVKARRRYEHINHSTWDFNSPKYWSLYIQTQIYYRNELADVYKYGFMLLDEKYCLIIHKADGSFQWKWTCCDYNEKNSEHNPNHECFFDPKGCTWDCCEITKVENSINCHR